MRRVSIKGFPGYMVDEAGGVWTCWKYQVRPLTLGEPWRLKQMFDKDGYFRVNMKNDKGERFKWLGVARLVATAFLENPQNLPVVRHKDSNPQNNAVDNLAWATAKDNIQDEIKRGTHIGGWNRKLKFCTLY